jgi:serine/threonine-protein kinase
MKLFLALLLLLSVTAFAQITQPDFDNAMKLLKGNESQKALSNLELLEKKFPTDAKVLFLRGFYQMRDENYNAAMMSFSNAIKANPKFTHSYGGRAYLFAEKGMLDKSISDMTAAIAIEPKNVEFYSKRADYYNKNQQNQEAANDCKTIIQLNPTNIKAYYDAATFSKLADANANVDVLFTQAYAAKGMQKWVVDFFFAKFLLSHNRFEEAKPLIESALAVGEKDFDGDDLNIAGIIFYKNNDLGKAEELLSKSIALNPNNADVYCNLASIYMDQEKWQKVAETADLALKADENNAMANMYMAIGLKKTGNESMAIRFQEKAKQLEAEQKK